MSMFYELMMKNKAKIMYATIKGSLTENDGVFSGFSASNYLQLQQEIVPSSTNVIEFQVKFNSSDISANQRILMQSSNGGGIILYSSHIELALYNTDGTRIINGSYYSSLSSNTDYYVNLKINGNQNLKIQIFDENKTLLFETTENLNGEILQTFKSLGGLTGTTYYFNGSIDLPNSYIKLDGTKYNLQAVVGYTVVGSPTISGGVVSGFSASDYLNLPTFAPTGRWKFIVGFTYSSQNTGTCYIAGNVDSFLVKTYDNFLQCALKVNGSSSFDFSASIGKTLADGEKCYCSIEFTGTEYKFSWSSDGTNWTLGKTYTSETNIRTDRGLTYGKVSNTVWLGTIIIKDCLIYKGNKLWFNGQQA